MTGTRPVAVLRPEPGNAATAARAEALGLSARRLPLFRAVPLAWDPPDPDAFDAVLLTSANAPRHAGAELARFSHLPVLAVGVATADAARDAGLHVRLTGMGGAASLLADAAHAGVARALHLCGRDRTDVHAGIVADRRVVYASEACAVPPDAVRALRGAVALLHSARAAARFAELIGEAGLARGAVRVAALSPAVADAAGEGWDGLAIAARPEDDALLAAALPLARAG